MGPAITFLEEEPTALDAIRDRSKAAFVIHLVALTTGVPAAEIARGARSRDAVVRARWLAMYLLHTALAVPLMRVASVFGRNRSTVGQMIGRIEDWRTDARFDEVVSALERCAAAAPAEVAPSTLEVAGRDDGKALPA